MNLNRIHYLGLFASPVSWAKVNREFVLGLERAGFTVSATPLKGLHHEPAFEISEKLRSIFDRERDADVEIAMEYPENLWKLRGDLRMAWIVYETNLPASWIRHLREHADFYLCQSKFVYEKALEDGFSESSLGLVPHGVNHELYQPSDDPADPQRPFTFLFIGPPHRRKGMREMVESYRAAFSASDDVRLLVKTYPTASDDRLYPWEINPDAVLDPAIADNPPEIRVISDPLSEREMVDLYHRSDLLVLPSYGEAFGLTLLEAMACGVPVLATGCPPITEIVNEENGWLIDCEKREMEGVAYDCDEPRPFFVPETDHLRTLLRGVFEAQRNVQNKRSHALQTARNYSWKQSGEAFWEFLRDVTS